MTTTKFTATATTPSGLVMEVTDALIAEGMEGRWGAINDLAAELVLDRVGEMFRIMAMRAGRWGR